MEEVMCKFLNKFGWVIFALLLIVSSLACSDKGNKAGREPEGPIGNLNQVCFEDGTCNEDLVCKENKCVEEEEPVPVPEDHGELGRRCIDDRICDEGLRCNVHFCNNGPCGSECVEPQEEGEECHDDSWCAEGLVCEELVCVDPDPNPDPDPDPEPACEDGDPIVFEDENLEEVVKLQLGIDEDFPICDCDGLGVIVAENRGISSIQGLENCQNLTIINLANNSINDLTPLQRLLRIFSLNLSGNQIDNLQPLVRNFGIGEGDFVDLRDNLLCADDVFSVWSLRSRRFVFPVGFVGARVMYDLNNCPGL